MVTGFIKRPASPQDSTGLSLILNSDANVHRHLDWRMPVEWLDCHPFWVLEQANRLASILAIPADPPHVAWVRLFAANPYMDAELAWDWLFESCLAELPPRSETTIAALGLSNWFTSLLPRVGFVHHQDVVTLAWDGCLPPQRPLANEIHLRMMTRADLPQVQRIDALAFEPIWQNSLVDIERSFIQAGYCTVAEMGGEVVGYQISTLTPHHLHLARLAVYPGLQRLSIGHGIVYHLLSFCQQELIGRVTVNTQDSNRASLGLYQKCNFYLTGDDFPVFIYM